MRVNGKASSSGENEGAPNTGVVTVGVRSSEPLDNASA